VGASGAAAGMGVTPGLLSNSTEYPYTDIAVLSVEPPANDFSISLERTQRPTERKHTRVRESGGGGVPTNTPEEL